LETSQSTQDGRLTATELATTTNAGGIAAIEAEQATQGGRLTTAESGITTNANAIAANAVDIASLEANDAVQDAAIAARLISFKGRTAPAVVPTAGDYDNSQITNVASLATGATTAAALDNLKTEINGIDASIASIDDKVTKGGDAGVISIGTTNASSVSLFANNVTKLTLDHNDGLIKLPGLVENASATGTLKRNPSTGAIHVDPNPTIPQSYFEGFLQTRLTTTQITFGAGQAAIGGSLINFSSMTKNLSTTWASGTGQGCQIGTWGNGGQWLYAGFNPTNGLTDFFASNLSTETASNGYTLRLVGVVWVASSVITDFYQERVGKYEYKTPINDISASFTAGTVQTHTLSVPSHGSRITAVFSGGGVGVGVQYDGRSAFGRVSQSVAFTVHWIAGGTYGVANGIQGHDVWEIVAESRQVKQAISTLNDQIANISTRGYYVNL